MAQTLVEQLKNLNLGEYELKQMKNADEKFNDAFVNDYMAIKDNIELLANYLDEFTVEAERNIFPIWIDATAITPYTTNGATKQNINFATNDVEYDVVTFPAGATGTKAEFGFGIPPGWELADDEEITYRYFYFFTNAEAARSAQLTFSEVSKVDGDNLDTAWDDTDNTYASSQVANVLKESASNIFNFTPIADENGDRTYAHFKIYRDPTNPDDTVEDVHLIGVLFEITTASGP